MAVALISSCELTDTGSASQPAVKSFGMDKMQLLEPEMGTQAIPVFQRLRRLTMRLNPANQDRPKTTLHVDEDSSSPFKKARGRYGLSRMYVCTYMYTGTVPPFFPRYVGQKRDYYFLYVGNLDNFIKGKHAFSFFFFLSPFLGVK